MSEEDSVPRQLRQAREARNQTLEQVYQECGLSVNVLQNLESGNFDVVEPVFVRLALATYAGHLGLDADSIVAEYDKAAGPPRQPPPPPPKPAPSAVSQLSPRMRLIGLGAGAGLVVLVLLLLALGGDEPEPQPPVPILPPPSSANRPVRPQARRAEPAATPSRPQATRTERAEAPEAPPARARLPEPEPAVEPQSAVDAIRPETNPAPPAAASGSTAPSEPAAPAAEPLAVAPAEPAAPAGTESRGSAPEPADEARAELAAPGQAGPATAIDSLLILEAEAVDSVWVQVKWDDANVFERLVPPGFRRTWQARSHFLVRAGRSHGMRYWFQGELLGDRGRLGDPLRTLRFRASREGVDLLDSSGNPLTPRAPADAPPDRPQ